MSSSPLKVWLPVFLFPTLSALGYHFLTGHFVKSGAGDALRGQCPPNAGPYNLQYTGLVPIASFLCLLVGFFQHSFDPANLPLVADLLASWTALVVLPFVEAKRQGRPRFLAFPVIHGLLYQTNGAGTMTRLPRGQAKITQAHAEATLFALLIGYVVMSGLMLTLQDPIVTAIWQPFPVWIWLAQSAHLLVRPASRHPESGYKTVQFTWAFTFLISAISHIAVVYPLLEDRATLVHYYVPRISVPDPETTTLSLATLVFLQWDGILAFGSGILGSLWFAETTGQALLIALWNLVVTPVLGSGAATSGVLMWREWRLNTSEGENVGDEKNK